MDLKSQFDNHLQKCPILAILRGIGIDEVRPVCDVLYDNGILLLEIPMNTPNVLECIRIAAEHCKGRQLVGAGTVLEPSKVTAVKQAGGQFIVSPNTDESVIRHTKAEGMLSIPGFFTATEGFQALEHIEPVGRQVALRCPVPEQIQQDGVCLGRIGVAGTVPAVVADVGRRVALGGRRHRLGRAVI